MSDPDDLAATSVRNSDSVAPAADRLIGSSVSHFRIASRIGAGGMGVVYRAEDVRLQRTVALKFLAPELTREDGARARFVQEARAASALDHPNICAIHEVGETDDGRTFIAMAYYDGETLDQKIARGSLSSSDATGYAIQIAEGVRAAHAKGIVHRDIKPANVLITSEGQVKLLDFGLAKLGGVSVTKAGTRLGTALYMSPEQARGEEADSRSDLWSLGVILFEMVTGARPFSGDSDAAVVHGILHEEPRFSSIHPAPLEHVIAKALEKDCARRYADAVSMIADLQNIGRGTEAAQRKSIVVLPFANMSSDPEQEYFTDGLTEEILTDLSKIGRLRVTSRTSSMMLKGTHNDLRAIARELDVQYVLEGSVRRAGDRLRVTAQLIDARSDAHLWAERYDGIVADVFDIQEAIAGRIVDALKLELSPDERRRVAEHPTTNVRAYEVYLRARQLTFEWTPEAIEKACRLMKDGLEIVGPNPYFYAGLAYVYFHFVNLGIEGDDYIARAQEYAERALELDPGSAEAHMVLGVMDQAFRGDQRSSFRHFYAALERNPDEAHALMWLIVGHTLVGRTKEAESLVQRLVRADPLTPVSRYLPVFVSVWGGQRRSPDDLLLWVRLEPESTVTRLFCAMNLCYQNYRAEAIALLRERPQSAHEIMGVLCDRLDHALSGEASAVDLALDIQLDRTARRDPQTSYFMADICAVAGQDATALAWLSNAVDRGFCNYPFMTVHDSMLERIRSKPEFDRIAERAKQECLRFDVVK